MKATDIIYKAKSATTGEWVQGNYINSFSPGIIHNKSFQGNWSAINPETLCIGFKDEAGNLWFTGDRVRFKSGKSGVIFFENFCLKIKIDGIFTPVPFSECNTPEIIGNIHD